MNINEEINEMNKYVVKGKIKVKKVGNFKDNKFYLYKEYYENKLCKAFNLFKVLSVFL